MTSLQDPAGALLRLVAGGAAEQELRAVPGTAPDAAEIAVGLRSRLVELEERVRSTDQLIQSLNELSGSGGLDALLRTVVARARRLLLSEVAYFLAFDAVTGRARVRVSDGIMSDAFTRLEVDGATGIAGFIAHTRTPSWTSDYLSDPRYRHTETIDTTTTEEGLRALVGVPVMKNGSVLGVLLASDRRVHDFRHQDVDLLQSLADHAAIIIDNERAHAAHRDDRRELETAVAELRSRESETQQLVDFQDRLFGVLLNGGSLQSLIRLIRQQLGGRVRVEDESGAVVVSAEEDDGGPDDGAEDDDGAGTAAGGRCATRVPLTREGRHLGDLVHVSALPLRLGEAGDRILTRAAATTALVLDGLRGSVSTGLLTASHLVQDLLRDPSGDHAIRIRAALGIDPAELDVVAVVECPATPRHELLVPAHRIAEERGGLAAEIDGQVLLWLRGEEPQAVAAGLHRAFSRALGAPVLVGADDRPVTPETLGAGLARAADTVRSLQALGWADAWALPDDVAPLPALLGRLSADELAAFVERELGPVMAYDRANGTALLTTLLVQQATGSTAQTARTLFVHPNTVHQRLARVEQLLADVRTTPLQQQLALTVRQLRPDTPHSPPARRPRNPEGTP
ncbi:hypothetical protein GCM10011374_06700 [Kocuria dechangensis]|uniref:GAF domain-containing protein n=1 Tax=Kocuria dechangensis TaxID=1176249 RepID=A0A917LNN4_9MICC|nr:GAF domain-containing protein [Kocuria dechangensis]GGG46965.1 hypothetical protein GCM10011374_06700 [Kocuria dechangensis]